MASSTSTNTWRSRVRWGRFKIKPTIKLEIESSPHKNDEHNCNFEIEQLSMPANESNSSIKTRLNNQASIGIPPETITSDSPYLINVPRLLKTYLNLMYTIGFLPNNYDGEPTSRWKHIFHQVLFWTFSTLCLFDALYLVKYFSIGYITRGNLYRYTVMSYMMLKTFIRLNFMYVLVQNRAKIVKVQKAIESVTDSMETILNQDTSTSNRERCVLGFTWSFTMVGALIATIFGSASIKYGWTLDETISLKSFQLSTVLFVWTSNLTEVAQVESALYDEYGALVTYISAIMGISIAVVELFGRIYDSAIDDVFLLVAFTIHKLLDDFQFEMVVHTATQNHYDIVWKHYRKLQNISEDMESAFGNVVKLAHFSNLIMCRYYLLMLTGPEGSTLDIKFILLTCTILKMGITYFIAVKAAHKNKTFRKWIQQMYLSKPYIIVGSTKLKTSVVLDESATNPIGLGSDNFHVDESFVMKFIGLVASYFLFLTQSKEKSS